MSRRLRAMLAATAAILIVLVVYLYFYRNEKNAKEEAVTEAMTFVEGMNYAMPVPTPDSLDFAGEPVPMEIYYVKEQLDREMTVNTYWHSATILILKRAARWLPVIEPILAENGIPGDFKYLVMIESGLMNAVSPSGAAGFWQFLEKTGKEYGLIIDREVDERYHVVKATRAACQYLLKSYDKFQSWTLVAASYNAGQNRIEETVRSQLTRDFYEMFLNEETSRYIFRILAMKCIFLNPVGYGFKLEKGDLYDPLVTRKVTVTESIPDLPLFARQNKISYRMLKELNPWLRSDKLTLKRGENYEISLPESH